MGGIGYNLVMDEARARGEAKLFPKAPLPDFADPTLKEQRSHKYMETYLDKLRFSVYHIATPEPKSEHQARFADRYDDPVEELPSLSSDRQKARMNPDFFPTLTWQSFYNKKARVAKKHAKVKKEGGVAGIVGGGDGAEGEEGEENKEEDAKSGASEEEGDEFDDEEENADYDNNYFDDGGEEGEEGDTGGGGGGADNEGGEYT